MDNREIDKLIANEITHYVSLTTEWNPIDNIYGTLPHYSTNIQDAWEIVNHFNMVDVSKDYNGQFECVIYACDNQGRPIECWIENAETASLAICKAALKANGVII